MKPQTILILTALLSGAPFAWAAPAATNAAPAAQEQNVTVEDGVIRCFPDGAADGSICQYQVGGKRLWVDAVRRKGRTREVRITSYVGRGGTKTPIKLFWPEVADGTISWNGPIQRDGDIVSATVSWNQTLIGQWMDVNEGGEEADALMKKLGVTSGADSKLPMVYSSGDSISRGYWPYLEAALANDANVYYQIELMKDVAEIKIVNNGHAKNAYGILKTAFTHEAFQPKYLLINCGLHMLSYYKAAQYREWIEKFDDLAKAHNSQLAWVTTTPYRESFRPSQNKVILEMNAIAKEVAKERGFPVVDLHACVIEAVNELGPDAAHASDGVHFPAEMQKRQANVIAERLREIIEKDGAK